MAAKGLARAPHTPSAATSALCVCSGFSSIIPWPQPGIIVMDTFASDFANSRAPRTGVMRSRSPRIMVTGHYSFAAASAPPA